MRRLGIAAVFFVLTVASACSEAGEEPLPEPLTLGDALRLAGSELPLLLRARAARDLAQADKLAAAAVNGAQLSLEARLRTVKPSYKSTDDAHNDSRARLLLKKRLYDFGYSEALQSAADRGIAASDQELLDARQQKTLGIMRAFFDVLLADLTFARDNEAMSIAYVTADKARDRNELGQLSDVELLRIEAAYEEVRRRRLLSEQQQRLTRSRLAIEMGRPEELASELEPPAIELTDSPKEDFSSYWARVEKSHPKLMALKARLEATSKHLSAARASESPVLSAELDAAVYNRSSSTTSPLGAGLVLEVPLYNGGKKDAAIMQAQAELTEARAEMLDVRLKLRQEALQTWLERERLKSDLQAIEVEGDYRDLYLDRSRALYELEVKTDLGDAMTRISDVRLKQARALFGWAMNEARLRAMTGNLLEQK